MIPTLVTPDFPYIHKELLKSGVTLKLLWQEYVDTCRDAGRPPYGYSQYCKLYQDYVAQNKLTMHIQHKPGDKLMVDWAGTTLTLYDKVTGNSSKDLDQCASAIAEYEHTAGIRIEMEFQFDDRCQTGIALAEIGNSACQIDGCASGKIKHGSSGPGAE